MTVADQLMSAPGRATRPSLRAVLREQVRILNPAYFALVMATGIVAIAAHLMGMPGIGRILAAINIAAYIALAGLTCTRVLLFPRAVFCDLIDHQLGVGFFTLVAATAILGSQSVILFGMYRLAAVLWVASAVLLLLSVYTIFTALTVKEKKPSLAEGIHSGWLVAVVATQAVATLGGTDDARVPGPDRKDRVHLACTMVERRDALHLDDFPDFLPVHVSPAPRARFESPLLDQYGRDGRLGSRWGDASAIFRGRSTVAGSCSVREGLHHFLLGHRDMVVPDAHRSGGLATWIQEIASHL